MLMRSIRADAQRRSAHGLRIGAVLVILALLVGAQLRGSTVGAPGLVFFHSVSWLGAVLITLAAIGHFSTSITEEKEEGTLGLLLLADISPLSILLGKSTNRVLSALLLFVAQFPFALLSLTLGGLTISQILAAYLTLAAFLFLMANLALLVSVLVPRTGEAIALMTLLSLVLHGFPPWLSQLVHQLVVNQHIRAGGVLADFSRTLNELYTETSVFLALDRIFDVNRDLQILSGQQLYSLVAGLLLFGLAWLRFRCVVWASDAPAAPRGLTPLRTFRWSPFVSRPWSRALAWKDFYFLSGGTVLMAAKLLLIPACVALCLQYREGVEAAMQMSVWRFLRQALACVLVAELLVYSSQLFHVEQKGGTLPTLMMLPYSAARIAYAKLSGCLLASVPTAVAALVLYSVNDAGTYRGVGLEFLGMQWIDFYPVQVACVVCVLCQLTVLCSLYVKWGALPLAAAIMLLGGAILLPLLLGSIAALRSSDQEPYAQLGPVIYTTAMLSLGLQIEIGRRIHKAAAE